MSVIREWMDLGVDAIQDVLIPYGVEGLILLSFFNSSISVIPTAVALVPLVLLNPDNWMLYGGIATVASVAGAVFAYYIGYFGGRPALRALSLGQNERVEEFVDDHGIMIVGLSGISPLPFKLFCICSGVFELRVRELVIVSTVFRGVRFFGIAFVVAAYGEPAVDWMNDNLTLGLTLLSVFVAVLYVVWIYRTYLWNQLREAI